MTLFLASILALALGPLMYQLAGRGHAMLSILDGFVFAAIGGLVLLSVLPETMAHGGWATVVFIALGFAGPALAERLFHRVAKHAHVGALALGLLGLTLHALFDGATLAGDSVGGAKLPTAVVVHRFPVGLAIWWLLRPHFGRLIATLVLALVAAATATGYGVGPPVAAGLSNQSIAWFQAFVAGSLLHVVFYRPHLDSRTEGQPATPSARSLEGGGALLGLLLLGTILVSGVPTTEAALSDRIVGTLLGLALETAPALLLAYAMAGLIAAFLPAAPTAWMTRGSAPMQAIRGMAFGLPLPICSCGVVPLYRALVVKGVPPTAAMAFLVATPELGLDAVFISVPLLGTQMTVIRVAGAAVVAFAVGWIVGKITPTTAPAGAAPVAEPAGSKPTVTARFVSGLRIGFFDVVDDTAPWILAGLGIAALATPFLEGSPLAAIPGGLDVVVFAVVGVPTYVCASAATPMVAAFIAGGLSPGAALAFLITGPATNVTTFGVLARLHGRRAAITFSIAIIGLSIALGYLVNAFFGNMPSVSLAALSAEEFSPLQAAALVGLSLVFALSLVRRGPRGVLAELTFRGS